MHYSYMDVSGRRFDLIATVLNAEAGRGGGRRARRRTTRVGQDNGDHFVQHTNVAADHAWIERELIKVKAKPGEYTEGSYERW